VTSEYIPYMVELRKISSWVRQSRHKAKKHDCVNRLAIEAVVALCEENDHTCTYCPKSATTLDHPFPLGDGAPNVIANSLPCCSRCKTAKKSGNLIAFMKAGNITPTAFAAIMAKALARDGGEELKAYLRLITGIGLVK
jgi:hypothetical protein